MSIPEKLPVADSARWQLLRAGIQNVWEYDDQRFVFHKGRLLLRGQNESGKTKALEVLLPFLLDASLHPQRLDPFGSNARSMRWNLLNDSKADVTVCIGYVWLELGRIEDGAPRYWTLGAGLKARRTANHVEDWYFATSKRVDEGLHLYDTARLPLTRPGLIAAVGSEGSVFDGAVHYRRALNEKLFGLGTDQYAALVDALLQLRRPQLSKALDPDELSRILSASLPPLDSGVVGSLAEGFDRLDRHRSEREESQATLLAVRSFLDVYRHYAAAIAKGRALELTRADSAFHGARAKLKDTEAKEEAARTTLTRVAAAIDALETETLAIDERLRVLRDSDEFRAVSQLESAERQARTLQASKERAVRAHDESQARNLRTQARLQQAQADAREDARGLSAEKEAALAAAQACALAEAHGAILLALEQGKTPAAQDTLAAALRMRDEALEALRRLARHLDEATGALDTATARAAAAEQRVRTASDALDQAAAAEGRARAQLLEDVEAWASSCRQLKLDIAGLLDLPPEDMRASIDGSGATVRQALDEALRVASLAQDTAALELKGARDEHAILAAQQHRPPGAPAWRGPRSAARLGAPLYLLCDFADGLDAAARAGLEAALEASGLLDAWVTPEGELLDSDTFDVMLVTRDEGVSPSLADALRPVTHGAVSQDRLLALLRSIGLGAHSSATWVSTDGRFALGPLRGTYRKPEAAFIGAAAREQARLKKLAELAARIVQLEAAFARRVQDVDDVRAHRAGLDGELRSFPDLGPLRDKQADARARSAEVAAARSSHGEELERVRRAGEARSAAAQALDTRAAEAGLRGWIDRLDELVSRTATWRSTAQTLLKTFERATRSAAEAVARGRELVESATELESRAAAAKAAQRESTEARAGADALRESLGQTREGVLAALRTTEKRQGEARTELKTRRDEHGKAQGEVGALGSAVAVALVQVDENEAARHEAEGRFRSAQARGLLAIIGVEGPGPATAWSYTDALLTARKVDDGTPKVDPSDAGRDKAWNRVSERHQELLRSLKPELRVLASQLEGVTVYEATFNARKLTLLELDADLEGDLIARDRLLAEEERKLFQSFLTGEAHEHLRDRLRAAGGLVKRMNRQLEAHPTSSGMQMRLQWDVAEDAAPGTREAVALLFKSGELMSDADRTALLGFLRQRLDEARERSEARTLQDQLLSVLDYRVWHTFEVQCRSGGEPWKRLTRKVHAAGSGGQKAVMLHLPLFAAAAAFYDSAREGAPRFILLDEAFAGIDRQTRGELMGLLSDFDLDFVMTSFEEWGFYPQLDGLSTYHLAREKGMSGVYSEWFVWNGREAVQMQA